MKLFGKSNDLDSAKNSRIKLAERLSAAQQVVVERAESVRRLAVAGAEDKALDIAEAALRAATDRVATFTTALKEIAKRIADLEAEQVRQADERQRVASAAEIEKLVSDLAKASVAYVAASSALAILAGRTSQIIPDGGGLFHFLNQATETMPATIEMLSGELQYHASNIIGGHAKAALPGVPTIAPPAPPKPEVVRVFAIKDVTWTNAEGVICTHHRWNDVDLPPITAARAIRINAAVAVTDPLRRKNMGLSKTCERPSPEFCVNLDIEPVTAVADPKVMQFETVDRGKPFNVRAERNAI